MLNRRMFFTVNRFLLVNCKWRLVKCNASASVALDINQVPSPKGLPLIGTTLSLIMEGSSSKLHRYIDKRHKQLGPIFKENIGPISCVFVANPDSMRAVFANEGKYPVHVLPEAWTIYNQLYNCSRGLFFMNGEEWLHFRRIMNTLLLKGDQTWIETACEKVSEHLVNKIDAETVANAEFLNLEANLYKWSLDVIVSILLGGRYEEARGNIEETVKELASKVHLIFETTVGLSLIPAGIAAKFNLPVWKRFVNSVDSALHTANNLVEILLKEYTGGNGLLDKMREQMLISEISKIVTDLILAAGDTTAYSMEWILYLMAKNDKVQTQLREDMKNTTSKPPLLKNIVRETLRLYPVAPFLTRILPEETTVSGYKILAGTLIVMSIYTTGRHPEYFSDPEAFVPDRWLRSSDEERTAAVQQASLPFAIGARSCIGRRIAETQLQSTLAKIVRNFNVELVEEKDVDVVLKMVVVPSEAIRLRFGKLT